MDFPLKTGVILRVRAKTYPRKRLCGHRKNFDRHYFTESGACATTNYEKLPAQSTPLDDAN
jgi:hypothetical protein